jgi:hypothetical protein
MSGQENLPHRLKNHRRLLHEYERLEIFIAPLSRQKRNLRENMERQGLHGRKYRHWLIADIPTCF